MGKGGTSQDIEEFCPFILNSKTMNTKHKVAATETFINLSKVCFIGGVVFGLAAVCWAATVPTPKVKNINEGRRYLYG
jgi:hypothetical protein